MMRWLSGLMIAASLAISVGFSATNPAKAAPTHAPRAPAYELTKPRLVKELALINAIRTKHNLRPFKAHKCLTETVAQPWAIHLAAIGKLTHRDLDTVFDLCPGFSALAENIAYGYGTPRAVVRAWMHSPGHRRNILRPGYRRIGLGVALGEDGLLYWVQNFGD